MKKLLALLLAAGMVMGTGALTVSAFDEDDYDNLDFFEVKETNETLCPGQDYYFETDSFSKSIPWSVTVTLLLILCSAAYSLRCYRFPTLLPLP